MKLLIFVLNHTEKLEDVVSAYVELGIPGATIVDSVGLGSVLSRELPIFAAFQSLMRESRASNKMLLSVVEDDLDEAAVVQVLEDICGPLSRSGGGLLFTVPVGSAYGFRTDEAPPAD